MLQQSGIERVDIIDIDVDDFDAVLTGEGNNIVSASVKGIDVLAKAKFDGPLPIFCSSIKVTIDIDNIDLKASYDYYSGNLIGLDAQYNTDVDFSCSGILGLPGISDLVDLFVDGESFVEDAIESGIAEAQNMDNFQNLFGLMQLLDDPEIAAAVDQAEDLAGFDISNFLNSLLDGLNLRVSLLRDQFGFNNHQVLISGFQTPATFRFSGAGSANAVSNRAFIHLSAPGANNFSLYIDGIYYGDLPSGNSSIMADLYPDSSFSVIAENTLFQVPSFSTTFRIEGNCSSGRGGRCSYNER